MSDTVQFREKLNRLLEIGKRSGNIVEKEEVEGYFSTEQFSEEQMALVYDYLLSQKVLVKGYVKEEPLTSEEEILKKMTQEELEFLRQYQDDIRGMLKDDPMKRILPQIVEMAKMLYHPDVFFGDLVQEGSLGMMLLMRQTMEETELLKAARESMQALIESQTEIKIQDQKMADKVNELDDKIKKLTEEMGRKISVDEVAQLLEISEEEVEDIVRLAGEDLEETE